MKGKRKRKRKEEGGIDRAADRAEYAWCSYSDGSRINTSTVSTEYRHQEEEEIKRNETRDNPFARLLR